MIGKYPYSIHIFRFPVQSMIFLPNGEFVHGLNANDLLDLSPQPASTDEPGTTEEGDDNV